MIANKLFSYCQLKQRTRWKQIFPILILITYFATLGHSGPSTLSLFRGLKKGQVSTTQCKAGIHTQKPMVFTCACVTGIWGFYSAYCQKPISIVGGESYCFKLKNHSISQVISFGNPLYPFEPTLNIFQKDFVHLTSWHRVDEDKLMISGADAFLTVMNKPWTVFMKGGGSLCLKARDEEEGKRVFCLFNGNFKEQGTLISGVKRGCLSGNVRVADSCSEVQLPGSDYADCGMEHLEDLVKKRVEEEALLKVDEEVLKDFENEKELIYEADESETENRWNFPIIKGNEDKVGQEEKWITVKKDEEKVGGNYIQIKPKMYNETVKGDNWIPIKPKQYKATPTPPPTVEVAPKDKTFYKVQPKMDQGKLWIPIPPEEYTAVWVPKKIKHWIPIQPKNSTSTTTTTTTTTTPMPIQEQDEEENDKVWIDFVPVQNSKLPIITDKIFVSNQEEVSSQEIENDVETNDNKIWIDLQDNDKTPIPSSSPSPVTTSKIFPTSSSSSEEWIPLMHIPTTPTTTTTTPTPLPMITSQEIFPEEDSEIDEDTCDSKLTRESVKEFWFLPENAQCSKSLTNMAFTDQLRRFTVKQFDKIFDSRLKSLRQMEQLLNYTLKIMTKTCIETYVPPQFFQVAYEAFVTFVNEDFFYGVEGADPEIFPRILKALEECAGRATAHVFEWKEYHCGFNKITGSLILSKTKKSLAIPPRHAHNGYEILIETSWKMFLNTHSYCFQDFEFSNDHHHFGVLIMELFTHSIYEKWIEDESKELYKFILPNFHVLEETMDNVDMCVAAVGEVSSCPVWLDRSSAGEESGRRKKRSIWVDQEESEKKHWEMWAGEAYCLQRMDDPEKKLNLTCHSF